MIAFAVMFGLLAVFVSQSWLNSQAEQRMRSLEANNKKNPASTSTIACSADNPLNSMERSRRVESSGKRREDA
jgi:hypothetical protein